MTRRDQSTAQTRRGQGLTGTLVKTALAATVGVLGKKLLTRKLDASTNPHARPGFPGEKHIVLPTPQGLTRANFAGPGTQIKKRLARGDRPVDGTRGIDGASKRHDIAYERATKESQIRKADKKMIREVNAGTAGRKTKKLVVTALRAKMKGEDKGLFSVNRFTQVVPPEGIGKGKSPEEVQAAKKRRRGGPAAGLLRHVQRKLKRQRDDVGSTVQRVRKKVRFALEQRQRAKRVAKVAPELVRAVKKFRLQ